MQKAARKGIIRNRFSTFLQHKQNNRKRPTSRFAKPNADVSDSQSTSSSTSPSRMDNRVMEQSLIDRGSPMVEMTAITLPPEWVDRFEECQSMIREISEIKKEMIALNTRRLNTIRQKQTAEIDRLTYDKASQATSKIRKCNSLLRQIQAAPKASHIDSELCKKMCMALSIEIQDKTREMRQQQREYLEYRKKMDTNMKVNFLEMSAERAFDDSDFMEQEFEYFDQESKLDDMLLEERSTEITKLVQNIHELNDMYRELSGLVIIQGSLLDQIDLNITEAATHTRQAKQNITKAREHQKSPIANRCLIALLAIITILALVMVIKYARR